MTNLSRWVRVSAARAGDARRFRRCPVQVGELEGRLLMSGDTTAPISMSAVLSGTPGLNGFYRSPVTIGVSATDPDNSPSSLTTFIREDGGTFVPTNRITIGNGTHTIQFYSVDPAGNKEAAVQTQTYKVDTTAPVTQSAVIAGIVGLNGFYRSPVTVAFHAFDPDNPSNTLRTFVKEDGGSFVPADRITIGNGIHTIRFFSTDPAGNMETVVHTQTYKVDTTVPVVTASANPSTLWPPNNKFVPVTVTGHVFDRSGGVPSVVYYHVYDEYGQVQPSGQAIVDARGNYSFVVDLQSSRSGQDKDGRQYTIRVTAIDEAGNRGLAQTFVTVPHDQGHGNGNGNENGNDNGNGNGNGKHDDKKGGD